MATCHLSAAMLREHLAYNPDTGKFSRLTGQRPGRDSGHIGGGGYVAVNLHGRQYMAHRLAWLHTHGNWPAGQIDHINGDKTDNRIANLRDVPAQVNCENQHRPRRTNKTMTLGVSQYTSGRFVARVFINGERHYLGSFSDKDAAAAAYKLARSEK